jgi:hypothetical protein
MKNFTAQITDAMQQYTGILSDDIEAAIKDVGKQTVKKVKSLSPVRTGTYKKGWTSQVEKRAGSITVTVHNKRYQLTHLLENGHKTKSGGKTKALPHIAPAEEYAEAEAMKAIEKAVKG